MTASPAEIMAAARQRAAAPPRPVTRLREATPPPADDPWLTVAEIAKTLHVSKETVYRAVRRGFLKSQPVGRSYRVRTSWVQAWLADGAETGGGK